MKVLDEIAGLGKIVGACRIDGTQKIPGDHPVVILDGPITPVRIGDGDMAKVKSGVPGNR